MKKNILIIFLFMFLNLKSSDLYLIDSIQAVVFGSDGIEVITKSEMDRPSLTGGMQLLGDIIFERLVFLDARKHKIFPDEEGVDAYLRQIQKENNLSDDELRQVFTASGYTFEEGRQKLQMMQTVNIMLDHEIRSNLIVSRKAVEAYYKENPVKLEATYTLERAFIPFSKKISKGRQLQILTNYSKTGKGIKDIEWSEPFMLNHSEIAIDKQYIYHMKLGDISQPHEVEEGFELFRLVAKTEERVKSLDESYREIVDILRRPKYEELMKSYRKKLFDTTSIVYF